MSKKRVFIIGAGASCIYGIPLGTNYLKECLYNDYEKDLPNDIEGNHYENIVIDYLNKIIPGGKKNWIDLPFELILSLLLKDSSFNKNIAEISYQPDMEGKLIKCLCEYLLAKSELPIINSTQIEYKECLKKDIYPYKELIMNLNSINDSIITTNYDTLIDKAVLNKYGNVRYSEYHKPLKKGQADHLDMSVLLLKPLGSINWLQAPGFTVTGDDISKYCYQISIDPPIWTHHDLNNFVGFNEYSAVGMHPVIIPPTIDADIPNRWGNFFVNINKQMLNKIANSDEIYIIGYSFPPYYEYFRIFMRRAIQLNKEINKNDVKLFVINKENTTGDTKNKDIREVIINYILDKDKHFYYFGDGFENWINIKDWSNISIYKQY